MKPGTVVLQPSSVKLTLTGSTSSAACALPVIREAMVRTISNPGNCLMIDDSRVALLFFMTITFYL